MTDTEITYRFTYHPPSEAGAARHELLSAKFIELARMVEDTCPDGREKSLVFTKLEEGKMWASAAVARNPSTR